MFIVSKVVSQLSKRGFSDTSEVFPKNYCIVSNDSDPFEALMTVFKFILTIILFCVAGLNIQSSAFGKSIIYVPIGISILRDGKGRKLRQL